MNNGEKESYWHISETCPAIDQAIAQLETVVKDQTSTLRAALTEARQRYIDAENEIDNIKYKLESLQAENDQLHNQIDEQQFTIENLQSTVDELHSQLYYFV